jgi:hypothetical protein
VPVSRSTGSPISKRAIVTQHPVSPDPADANLPEEVAAPALKSAFRGPLAVASVTLAAILFVLAIVLLYYRWVTVTQPSSMVEVQGTSALAGAVVSVSGPGLKAPLVTTLDEGDHFRPRFFLNRGSYTVTVIRDDEPYFQQHFFLDDHMRGRITLPVPPTTAPAVTSEQ